MIVEVALFDVDHLEALDDFMTFNGIDDVDVAGRQLILFALKELGFYE